jgi:pimeloyl-ACP methyl ester carboxylesterase
MSVKVVVNNLMINYSLSGQGKTVLLVHGWGDNINGLSGLIKDLSKSYQVIAIDMPGFGDSENPREPWGLSNYAGLLKDFLSKVGIRDLYAAIGHSNGGAVLLRATALPTIQPQKLVLLATAGVRTGHKTKRLMLKTLAKTGNVATIWMPERYRQGLRKSLYGAAGSDELAVPELKETFRRVVREDVQADAKKIKQSTLLIYAADDKAVPLSTGQTYNSLIKGSKLEVITHSGHFVHIDQPEQTLSLIRGFLK